MCVSEKKSHKPLRFFVTEEEKNPVPSQDDFAARDACENWGKKNASENKRHALGQKRSRTIISFRAQKLMFTSLLIFVNRFAEIKVIPLSAGAIQLQVKVKWEGRGASSQTFFVSETLALCERACHDLKKDITISSYFSRSPRHTRRSRVCPGDFDFHRARRKRESGLVGGHDIVRPPINPDKFIVPVEQGHRREVVGAGEGCPAKGRAV